MKRTLKIGLVGMMTTPFRGDKETQYKQSIRSLGALSQSLGFKLVPVEEGIYTEAQALAAAAVMKTEAVDFVLIQASSFSGGGFIYPFAKLDARLGLWGVPEGAPTEEGGLPLNSFTAVNMYNSILKTYLTGYKKPVKWFFGRVGDALFVDRFKITVQALTALINLKDARVGIIGGVAPGFDNLIVNERNLLKKLGVTVVPVEFDRVLTLIPELSENDLANGKQALLNGVKRVDTGVEKAIGQSAAVYAAIKQIVEAQTLDAVAVSCWPRFQESMQLAVCSVMGALNANGIVAACEGDLASAVSMLTLSLLNQSSVVTLMDLVTIDDSDDSLLMWHCGPTAPQLADESGAFVRSLWLMEDDSGKKAGLSNDLVLAPGAATVMGFTPDFKKILVFDGELDNQKPSYRGSRAWMRNFHINGKPAGMRDLVETILTSGYQHHYPLALANCSAAVLELSAWAGIPTIPVQRYQDALHVEQKLC